MKIYTITCNNAYNYGAVLQAYALQKYLEKLGNEVEVINYKPPFLRKISKQYRNNPLAIIIRKILYYPDYHKSSKVFSKFRKEYLNETQVCRSVDDIERLPEGELYICGSDQIWNPEMENGYCPEYFMKCNKPLKKASYAASIGLYEVGQEYIDYLGMMLRDFIRVTVREKASIKTLLKAHIDSEYVVDPVYLLTSEDWRTLEIKKYNKKYVLVYALHHMQEIYDYATNLGRSLNCAVYIVSVEIKERRRGGDKFFWNPSVQDFISLMDGAQAIVTNSFHGISFSCILSKPVHIFDTEKNDIRIKNIIEIFDLNDRVISQNVTLIDNRMSAKSVTLMQKEIERSKIILNEILRKAIQ